MPLKVCVLGESLKEAVGLLDKLCEANADDIFRRRTSVGIMSDGTELLAFGADDMYRLRGWRFDYIFYEDGMLPTFCWKHGAAMEYLEQGCLTNSGVPREFQWCAVNTNI